MKEDLKMGFPKGFSGEVRENGILEAPPGERDAAHPEVPGNIDNYPRQGFVKPEGKLGGVEPRGPRGAQFPQQGSPVDLKGAVTGLGSA